MAWYMCTADMLLHAWVYLAASILCTEADEGNDCTYSYSTLF